MKIYRLERTTLLNTDLDNAWKYFSSPANLNEITPPDMEFKILSPDAHKPMYQGMIIQYKIRPFPFVSFGWLTEITHCSDKKFFVDEQRFGPYTFWHHQHHFEKRDDGLWMTDIVHYGLPLGILGRFAHAIFVRKKLEQIFNFRTDCMKRVFG
jgi:ligand-binding SRPBCC domain-containing protein